MAGHPEAPFSEESSPQNPIHIMVVEDNNDMITKYEELATMHNHRITVARTVEGVRTILDQGLIPDAMFIDGLHGDWRDVLFLAQQNNVYPVLISATEEYVEEASGMGVRAIDKFQDAEQIPNLFRNLHTDVDAFRQGLQA